MNLFHLLRVVVAFCIFIYAILASYIQHYVDLCYINIYIPYFQSIIKYKNRKIKNFPNDAGYNCIYLYYDELKKLDIHYID